MAATRRRQWRWCDGAPGRGSSFALAVAAASTGGAAARRRAGRARGRRARRQCTARANGRAALLFADGSQVKLNTNTVLLIPPTPGRGLPSHLGLRAGEIWARIIRGRGVSIETPYAVANTRTEYHPVPLILRSGSYRGLAATANHFAREMHMDALARAAKLDAVEFRLQHMLMAHAFREPGRWRLNIGI